MAPMFHAAMQTFSMQLQIMHAEAGSIVASSLSQFSQFCQAKLLVKAYWSHSGDMVMCSSQQTSVVARRLHIDMNAMKMYSSASMGADMASFNEADL